MLCLKFIYSWVSCCVCPSICIISQAEPHLVSTLLWGLQLRLLSQYLSIGLGKKSPEGRGLGPRPWLGQGLGEGFGGTVSCRMPGSQQP
jgi:hypothetical protein